MSAPPPYYDDKAAYPPAQNAPPSAPYPPSQQTAANTTVVVQQPATVQTVRFGEAPVSYNCHVCHTQQVTRVSYSSGTLTWLLVLLLCLLGLWPCALIPLCIDGTKDAYHTCPNCNSQVGVYKRV